MKIKYDKIADAIYIYLNKKKIKKSIKLKNRLIVDIDDVGKIVGIEILSASLQIPRNEIKKMKIETLVFA